MCFLCLTPVPVQCLRNLNVLGLYSTYKLLAAHGLDSRDYGILVAFMSPTHSKTHVVSVFVYISINTVRGSRKLFFFFFWSRNILFFSLLGIVTVKTCLQNDKSVQ